MKHNHDVLSLVKRQGDWIRWLMLSEKAFASSIDARVVAACPSPPHWISIPMWRLSILAYAMVFEQNRIFLRRFYKGLPRSPKLRCQRRAYPSILNPAGNTVRCQHAITGWNRRLAQCWKVDLV